MILYNITLKIDHEAHDELMQFVKDIHLPEMLDLGIIKEINIYRLREEDTSDGFTYSIQYKFENAGTLEQHLTLYDNRFKQYLSAKYKFRQVNFSSILESI